tara:strand:+ start:1200 stop:1574 length:375 start_codon:yes stop_codon:yes gene_type:complete
MQGHGRRSSSQARVLYVDDDFNRLKYIADGLRAKGFIPLRHDSILDASLDIRERKIEYDAVVIRADNNDDVSQVVEASRATHPKAPIITVGSDMVQGVDQRLTLPYSPEKLADTIAEHLRKVRR